MIPKNIKEAIIKDRRLEISFRKIGIKYNLHKATVQRIVNSYGKTKLKVGRKEKLTKGDKRRIKSLVDDNNKKLCKTSSTSIIKTFNLNVSSNTVCRFLRCVNYSYTNLKSKFTLLKRYRQKRIDSARDYIKNNINWFDVIFTDEKRFSLTGCDSFYTWVNKNGSYKNYRKMIRAPSLMIWGMLMPNGLMSYKVIEGNQNSLKYINILKESAIPMIYLNFGKEFIFQHDNCPIHVSKETRNFFVEAEIKVLDFPPYSPDLNIIENMWSLLSGLVYKDGLPKNLRELKDKIHRSINLINATKRQYIINLYKSMSERICKVLEMHGKTLKY